MTRRRKKYRAPGPCDPERSEQMACGAVDHLTSGPATQVRRPYVLLAVCGLLLLAVIAVFGQTAGHDFVNFDDDVYVYDNPMVTAGVTLKGLAWAFLHPSHVDYWRPLSFLSHLLDCQFYGLWAGGHHLTNVLLHMVVVVVLFLVLQAMTGGMWRSALVAAVFAIHPLRVESVAWVTERKDVLGGLFFVLTLAAYVRYARRPAPGRYGAVAVLFAAGLMCKPTLVPLPLVLLLLDYWPLGRTGLGELVLEKLPLLALAAASCFLTVWTGENALQPVKNTPLSVRTGNALVSVLTYVGQLFWPAGLAPWYPNPEGGPAVWAVGLAVVALLAVSAAVLAVRRRQPWLLTGWFWYLAMLTPTLSMSQARMDRFTYLSQIGVCVALTWAAAERTARWRGGRRAARWAVAAGAVTALSIVAHAQCAHWRDSESLWTHTVACTSRNPLAHTDLGLALASRGEFAEAIEHYRTALEIQPDSIQAHNDLGLALAGCGKFDEAIDHFRTALEINPDYMDTHYNLGTALAGCGKFDEAIDHFRTALEINPDYMDTHYNLGLALASRGEFAEAIDHYRKVLEFQPDFAEAHNNLGLALAGCGKFDEAIDQYRTALKIEPDYVLAHTNLGVMLASRGQADEAIDHFRMALEIKPDYVKAHVILGDVLADGGRFAEALEHYQKALGLVSARNDRAMADAIRARIRPLQSAAPGGKTP
jgi:Flp pilus assembly protein TadD